MTRGSMVMKVVKIFLIIGIVGFANAQELKTVAEKVDAELKKDDSKAVVLGTLKLHGLNVKQDKDVCPVLSDKNYSTVKAINKDTSYIKLLNIKPVSNVVVTKTINKSDTGFFDKVIEFIKDIF